MNNIYGMSGELEKRLKRLLSFRECRKGDIETYIKELRETVQDMGDEESFKKMERFFKALADSRRLKIIKMLEKREMCVCEVMAALNLTQGNASHHLNILEREGIVKKRHEGKWVFYSLNTPKIIRWINQMQLTP